MEGADRFHLLALCERTSLGYDVFALGWCDIVGSFSMRKLAMQSFSKTRTEIPGLGGCLLRWGLLATQASCDDGGLTC